MAAFFYGEPSPDLFMMNLNPFSGQTTTTNVHNNHFGLQQHGQRVGKLDQVDNIEQGDSPISTFSNGGVLRDLAPAYMRAAQELLNEIVNVGNRSRSAKQEQQMSKESVTYGVEDICCGHKPGVSACRQELQMKKAKLISLVEKVEQKYKQYHDQMQTIVSSFEQAAGLGSANSYTQMVLQTISKQFRAVKDIICLQIKHINKLLGEKECNKHLGKMSHYHSNAWRPQRGLPEKAVSILRAWLFEHFLHPYPRDLDKEMLAKQTGLTKSQVSNWFINARVRVWKPMVEELYLEEMDSEERDGSKPNDSNKLSSMKPYYDTTVDESSSSILPAFHQGFIENEISTNNSSSSCSVARFTNQHVNQANLIHFNGGFENYHAMVENGVSLSLGLPHSCDQSFTNIQFRSTSHGTEISGIYPSSTFQIMD